MRRGRQSTRRRCRSATRSTKKSSQGETKPPTDPRAFAVTTPPVQRGRRSHSRLGVRAPYAAEAAGSETSPRLARLPPGRSTEAWRQKEYVPGPASKGSSAIRGHCEATCERRNDGIVKRDRRYSVPLGQVIEFQQRGIRDCPQSTQAWSTGPTMLTIEPCPLADEILNCCCSEPESRAR